MSKKDKSEKPDRRKIPKLFRAVEKTSRPTIFHGYLVGDDGFNFISYSVHDGDESIFKERVRAKNGFRILLDI